MNTIINAFRVYEPEVSSIFEGLMPYYGTDKEQNKIDKELEQYSQAACVDITGDLGSFTSGVQELLKFQEVCVVPDDSSELLVQYNTGENDTLVLFIGGRGLWQFVTAEQVEQITAQNMETAWNVARQGGYEDVSLLTTQEFEQIFVLKK